MIFLLGFSLVFCLVNSASAAKLAENDPRYNKLVSLTEQQITEGHPYTVNGVYVAENGDEENEYVVRLEVEKNPSELCSVTFIDSITPGTYSVIDRECLKEVEEQPIEAERRPRVCAGCPQEADVTDPLAAESAQFALSHYNSLLGSDEEQATEVKIISVQSQVVSGVKHIFELEFSKDGTPIKKCRVDVWTRVWMKPPRKVTKLDCSPREAKEVFSTEDEIKDVSQRFVQNVVSYTMDALNDLYKSSSTKKISKGIEKASLKQTINGPLYEFVLDVDTVECLTAWNEDGSCDDRFKLIGSETCTVLVSDQSRILRQKPFKVVQSRCSKRLNTVTPLQRKKRNSFGGHHDYNLDIDERLAEFSVSQLEHKLGSDHMLKIVRVLDSRVQVVSGRLYHLTFEVGTTTCHLNSVQRRSDCEVDEEQSHQICEVQIWEKPWLKFMKMSNYTCSQNTNWLTSLDPEDAYLVEKFKSWAGKYEKSYESDGEMQKRFAIFKQNMAKVKFLQKTEQGTATYGATKFADLTAEEFKKYLGFRPTKEPYSPPPAASIPDITLPESWDWRKYNVVTHVKDQGFCGSCWAFSVTGNIEGQYGVHHNKLYDLSEQELVDCDKVDQGCQGGYMLDAYKAVMRLGGLENERAYPYRAHRQNCHFNKTMVKVSIKSSVNITKNETGMAKWLVKNGPISIGINANAMQFYFGGVSHPWKVLCDPSNIDHGVLLVGYGVHTTRFLKKHVPYWIVKNSWGPGWGEQLAYGCYEVIKSHYFVAYPLFNKTMPFWIVKNSWGPGWGEMGYYRVYRGDGTCGVNQYATSAVV